MHHSAMSRCASLAAAVTLSLAIAGGPVMAQAQTQQPGLSLATAPAPGNATEPADRAPVEKAVEGPVKKVDPAAQTVQISAGLFGLMGRTLQVDEQTQIQVEGRQGTLADVVEGTKVKAAYESRDGKNVATRIEVMPVPITAPGATTPAPSPTPLDLGAKSSEPKY